MKSLNREININKKFILALVLVNIIALGLYYSYALFQVTKIQDGIVVINTGTINLTVSTGETNNTFTVAAGASKSITVSLSSTNPNQIGYKLYYTKEGNSTVEIKSPYDYPNNVVQGVMTSSTSFPLTFNNTGSSSVTITVGAVGGLSAYPVVLGTGQTEITLTPMTGSEKVLSVANSIQNCTRTVTDQTDGIVYISGNSDNPSIYSSAATDPCIIDFNYVWWSGKMWRITSIYPDGAMKLITDNDITTISFNASGQVYYYTKPDPGNSITEAKSYIFQWLNEDFLSTLYNQGSDVIDYTKYWNETMPSAAAISTKPAEDSATMIPTTTSPIGLLTSYEHYKSYQNTSYGYGYLKNGYYYWLLNPAYNATAPTSVWRVTSSGGGGTTGVGGLGSIRPSIIIKSGITMNGNGTKTSPYRITTDYADATANDSLYTRHSGEYIKFASDGNNGDYTNAPLYRIVEVVGTGNTRTTKIVSMNFASYDVSGTPTYTKQFGASNNSTGVTWGTCTSNDCWSYYLNDLSGEWYTNLSFKNKLTSGTYYLGQVPSSNRNYKLSVCSASNFDASNTISDCITNGTTAATWTGTNGDSGNVGILRYGEMFAARQQPGDMSSITNMWLISSYSTSGIYFLTNLGVGGDATPTTAYGVRPSYFLKSSVNVLSGSGTELDPFIVD